MNSYVVIYVHGFGGSGQGVKAKLFREFFHSRGWSFFAPSLSYVPELAISTLEEIISLFNRNKIYLIGSSLGGFYAIYLSQKFNIPATLINPAIFPSKTLQEIYKTTQKGLNQFDLSYFEFNRNHINTLKNYKINEDSLNSRNFFVMLQKDDDVIDYKIAKRLFDKAKTVITQGGGHSFYGIENHFIEIENFFKNFSSSKH